MKINLDIGDTILTGRFKNKPVVVKQFGKDDKGQPTVNGRPMLKFRIKKLMQNIFPTEQKLRKIIRQRINEILDSVINEADKYSGQGMWSDFKKYKIQKPPRKFAEKAKVGAMIHFTGPKSGAKGETWKKWTPLSWKAIFGAGVKGDALSNSELDEKLESHARVQIKESGTFGAGDGPVSRKTKTTGFPTTAIVGSKNPKSKKSKLLMDKLSKSQMAFMQNQMQVKKGDTITYDQYFKFGKVSRDQKSKVVAIHGHRVLLANGSELDLRSYPIKKVNNKVYDRDTSMYDDVMMR